MPKKQVASANEITVRKNLRQGLFEKILLSTLATLVLWPIVEIIIGVIQNNQVGGLAILTVFFSFPLFVLVPTAVSILLYKIPATSNKTLLYCVLPTPIVSLILYSLK